MCSANPNPIHPSDMTTIQATSASRFTAIIRILIALPLIGIGISHLTGASPMLPILEGAGIPFPEFNAVFIPAMRPAATTAPIRA